MNFAKFTFILICLTLPTALHANDELDVSVGIYAHSVNDDDIKSLIGGTEAGLSFKHEFNSYLYTKFNLLSQFYAGSAVGLIPADALQNYGPRSIFLIRNAFVGTEFFEHHFEFKIGVINQSVWNDPLLLGDMGFASAAQSVHFSSRAGSFTLSAEQAVPDSSSSILQTAEPQATPLFFLERFSYETAEHPIFGFKFFAGYFQYDDLTTAQAKQSRYFGNSVEGSQDSPTFLLTYVGVDAGLDIKLKFSKENLATIAVNALQNTSAPAGSDKGYIATASYEQKNEHFSYLPELTYFYNQSDSAPAAFSDSVMHSADRQGYSLLFKTKDLDDNFSVLAQWIHSAPLIEQEFVSPQNQFLLGLETSYEVF